jgi:hypothetical protein
MIWTNFQPWHAIFSYLNKSLLSSMLFLPMPASDRKFAEESKLLRKTLIYGSIISKTCQKVDIFLIILFDS